MKKEEIQTWTQSFKTLSAILIPAVVASMVESPVYSAGLSNFLLQSLFEVQSDVKLQRVDSMLRGLEESLQSNAQNIIDQGRDIQELRDVFETAIVNTGKANTESKIDRIRKILYGQITDPQPYDYTTRYLDLAIRLNDEQVRILQVFYETEIKLVPIRSELRQLNEELQAGLEKWNRLAINDTALSGSQKQVFETRGGELKANIARLEHEYNSLRHSRIQCIDSIDKKEFPFLFNDLRVLGLVYNPGEGKFSSSGEAADFECTALATGFMRYVHEEKDA